jgi:ERF superfamily
MKVYQAIGKVSADMASTGIAKGRKNEQQGYKFRGIDEVFNALAPSLVKNGLVILPRMVGRSVVERQTKNGGVLFYVVVDAEFDFVATEDGSKHTIRTFGEAMDSGDKATNKAMSAAYKYAAFQAFCIPTEGDNDADATTHDVAAQAPEGYAQFAADLKKTAAKGTDALKTEWLESPIELRAHMTATDAKGWEALKAEAAQADKVAA